MSPAHPLPSDPRFLAVLDGIEVFTRRPSLVIAAMPVESLPVTASKFSGVPYLPRDGQVPLDDEGEQMALLAQFRLADLPANDFLPATGLLQFWLNRWDIWPSEDLRDGPFHVTYHPQIDESVTPEEVLERYASLEEEPGDWMPFHSREPLALSLTMTSQPVSTSDHGFDSILADAYNRAFPQTPIRGRRDMPQELADPTFDRFHATGHRLGGYPYFTQEDPRGYGRLDKEDVLLLQLDSDYHMTWGDVGVANFFINPRDLAAGDFSKVAFTWDDC